MSLLSLRFFYEHGISSPVYVLADGLQLAQAVVFREVHELTISNIFFVTSLVLLRERGRLHTGVVKLPAFAQPLFRVDHKIISARGRNSSAEKTILHLYKPVRYHLTSAVFKNRQTARLGLLFFRPISLNGFMHWMLEC